MLHVISAKIINMVLVIGFHIVFELKYMVYTTYLVYKSIDDGMR